VLLQVRLGIRQWHSQDLDGCRRHLRGRVWGVVSSRYPVRNFSVFFLCENEVFWCIVGTVFSNL